MPWRRGREFRRRCVAWVASTLRVRGRSRVAGFARTRRHFEAIEGFCHVLSAGVWDALLAWQRERGVRGHLLEIGVFEGKSAAILAARVDPASERLFLVDSGMVVARVVRNLARVRPEAAAAIAPMRVDSRRLEGSDLLSRRAACRWIHVDGGHSAECVRNDLEVAHALLAPDGIVTLDDFFDERYPQITETTLRVLAETPDRFAPFLLAKHKGYLCRPDRAPQHRHFCLHRLVPDMERRGFRTTLWKTGLPGEIDCFALCRRQQWRQRVRGTDGDRAKVHSDAWA